MKLKKWRLCGAPSEWGWLIDPSGGRSRSSRNSCRASPASIHHSLRWWAIWTLRQMSPVDRYKKNLSMRSDVNQHSSSYHTVKIVSNVCAHLNRLCLSCWTHWWVCSIVRVSSKTLVQNGLRFHTANLIFLSWFFPCCTNCRYWGSINILKLIISWEKPSTQQISKSNLIKALSKHD